MSECPHYSDKIDKPRHCSVAEVGGRHTDLHEQCLVAPIGGEGRHLKDYPDQCYRYQRHRAEVAEAGLTVLGEGWLPTSDAINALPEGVRRFVHSLETRCDPAGIVAQNAILSDQGRQLQAALAAANKKLEQARGLVGTWQVHIKLPGVTEISYGQRVTGRCAAALAAIVGEEEP